MDSPNPAHLPIPTGHFDMKWGVLIAIGTGTFMSALDTSVVNTVLPVVSRTFQADIATVEWVVIIYLLFVSGMLPGFGRLGDLHGHKPVFISGFILFIGSSLVCALSPSVYALIGARGFQSLAAAMLSANSPAILTKTFPATERGRALGLQATMTYLGLVVGPSLGGWLTDQFGWRSVFFINLPVGLVAMYLSLRFIPRDIPKTIREKFDWPGAVTFMGGLTTLLLALNRGHSWGWTSPAILGLTSISVFLLVSFIRLERKTSSPMLDLSLFHNRGFSSSITAAVLNYICVYSVIFLMPFYLINGRGMSPSQAGLFLTAQPIVMAVVAPISGSLSDRIGSRTPGMVGMGLLAIGLLFMSQLGSLSSALWIMLALGLCGLGIGIFISPNNSVLMGSAPTNRQGIAAGLLATARNVGMVLGVGFSGAIYSTTISRGPATDSATLFHAIQVSYQSMILVALLGLLVTSLYKQRLIS